MKLKKVISYNIDGVSFIIDDQNKLMETTYALELMKINYEVYWIKDISNAEKDI